MEQKTWLWRRKASEKTAQGNDKHGLSLKGDQEEVVKAEEFERSLKNLSEKLMSALTESNAKDDLLSKHTKVAEEALEGWERAEAEAASLKQELDEALQCKFTAEERIAHLETALEECKQQLQMNLEEQKQVASDTAMKTLREKEKTRKLEERLGELNRWLSKLGSENNNLIKALEIKEKVIEDLNERNNQADAKISSLTENLDSLEKNIASLKYEVCMLEKELQIRSEEKEFNLKSADALHKQHLESIKKIAKLESECQRLRVMVRKRLPGPAALAKMRSEVEMLGRDTYEMKNKKSNPSTGLLTRDFTSGNYTDSSNKRVSLVERLNAIEEENKVLKETLTKKNSELQSARVMCTRTASKLSQVETQHEEISKGQTNFELTRSSPLKIVSQRSLDSILEEIRVTLAGNGYSVSIQPSGNLHVNGENSQEPQHSSAGSYDADYGANLFLTEADVSQSKSKLSKSVNRLIKLIEGINEKLLTDDSMLQAMCRNDENAISGQRLTYAGYISRAFHLKTSELTSILQCFIRTCNNLVHPKTGLKIFFEDLNSALEWIINHYFSLQDISSMKDTIKKLDCYELFCENEREAEQAWQCQGLEQIFAYGHERKGVPCHL